ncbi:MAG: hypothetical protein ABIQ84_08410 [Usitatibacter sp.]
MKFLFALAAGTVGYCYFRGCEARQKKVGAKEELHRWEAEGGNVPAVATPSPAPTPKSSNPAGGDARH